MHRTNIYLNDEQIRLLKHLAAEEGESVAGLVRQAVDHYLQTRTQKEGKDWQERFQSLIHRVQERIPAQLTSEEIEADITQARKEVRQKHARRG